LAFFERAISGDSPHGSGPSTSFSSNTAGGTDHLGCRSTSSEERRTSDHSLTYCEGFVLNRTGKLPIHHAWVTDGTGRAIDNTLVESASAYFGVPFNTAFLCRYYLKTKDITSMLDDYEHHWPLLRRLGDKPEKWLEPKGCGLARLT